MVDIVIEGPGKNALSSQVMGDLIARIKAASGAPLLVTGANDAFSAGLNLKELQTLDAAGMEQFLVRLEELIGLLFTHPAPTVAAVNGHAIAGGCIVALCCDHRVCSPDARVRIGLNEVALGLQFPPNLLRMLRMRLSPERCSEVVMGATLYEPKEALRVGFVDELSEDPQARAREHLALLASYPRDAYTAAKQALRGTSLSHPEDKEAFRRMLPAWTSPELKARIAAVLTKR